MPLLGSSPLPGHAQDGDTALPLFAEQIPLQLTIEAPLRTLSRERREREELDGFVRYRDATGAEISLDVQVRTRGNSRMALCTYPPLRLDFRRGQVTGTVFAGQNRLKLATLCKDLRAYRDYLALEFEIYRIFNTVTESSYRVRWVEVTYIDMDDPDGDPELRPGFLIEEDSEVAARNGMEPWERETIDLDLLEPRSAALLSVFQFMIGNTDWSGTTGPPGDRCCHNGDVLRNPQGLAVLIPYDFDQAGLILADYAAPAAELSIRSVRQRLYRGYCIHNDELGGAFDRFRAVRAEIETLLSAAAVRERTRARALRYIEDFYEILDSPEEREESIAGACRG